MRKRCKNCHLLFIPNPRVKNQQYCSHPDCQRARKREWQRKKLQTDPDYRQAQREANDNWRSKNRDYWKQYRQKNSKYTEKNRQLQRERNKKRSQKLQNLTRSMIAKMDASNGEIRQISGKYKLIPLFGSGIAKMDALTVELSLISTG